MTPEPFTPEQLRRAIRPTLGDTIPIEWFRLLRLNAMYEVLGEAADDTLYLIGRSFGKRMAPKTMEEFSDGFAHMGLGRMRLLSRDDTRLEMELAECATCSGLPDQGRPLCSFEAGFIAGGVESITGRRARARETSCASMTRGDACRYEVQLL